MSPRFTSAPSMPSAAPGAADGVAEVQAPAIRATPTNPASVLRTFIPLISSIPAEANATALVQGYSAFPWPRRLPARVAATAHLLSLRAILRRRATPMSGDLHAGVTPRPRRGGRSGAP